MIMVFGDGLGFNIQLKLIKLSFELNTFKGNNLTLSKSVKLFCLIICFKILVYSFPVSAYLSK